ncbi:hypothetical protein KEM52_005745 [Ascosphaera acerosa]|nr:hypothetical protein KEM52_005745 [Ascosphaera acerosa]
MNGRRDFLNQPAPENYVAGLGRGATGFTTRSDLGPAKEGPTPEQFQEALAKRAAALGTSVSAVYAISKGERGKSDATKAGASAGAAENDKADDDDERFQDPENEVGLFAYGSYDREDDEADRIYQAVDERMERRRKLRREARERQEREEYERNHPKIQQQFADLKRSLATVTDEEWNQIPEVGDLTGKNRRARQQLKNRFYAVPDSVIAGALSSTQYETTINPDGTESTGPAAGSSGGDAASGTMTNFANIGAARDKVLQVRLDQAAQSSSDAASGSATNIDPKGYLTSLTKSELKAGEVEIGDIKRIRVLLESVTKTNPRHAPGWIAIARLEELAGRIAAARNHIAKGNTAK